MQIFNNTAHFKCVDFGRQSAVYDPAAATTAARAASVIKSGSV